MSRVDQGFIAFVLFMLLCLVTYQQVQIERLEKQVHTNLLAAAELSRVQAIVVEDVIERVENLETGR